MRQSTYSEPDWSYVHRELARVGVTLKVLHGEYADKVADEGGIYMSYDTFCRRYQEFPTRENVTSRIERKAGRFVEMDWVL